MNREVAFRGKRCSDGKWVYGFYVESKTSWRGHKPHKSWIVPDAISNGGFFNVLGRYAVKDDTVGQFTGLRDKNGVKIFEGDIIRVREYENLLMNEFFDDADRFDLFTLEEIRGELKAEYVSPVVFLEGSFQISSRDNDFDVFLACMFGDMRRSSPSFEFEVIGNIYDNPELLDKESK